MAIGTTAAILGGVSAATSLYQTIDGMNQANEAEGAIDSFERQELKNVYENIPISTIGSDLIREENGRVAATLTDAARSGGVRGLNSVVPKIQAGTNEANKKAQTYIDKQVQDKAYAKAQDEVRIQSIQENRDNAELAGMGNLLNVGRQNMFDGIRGFSNSVMSLASNMGESSTNSSTETDAELYDSATPNYGF